MKLAVTDTTDLHRALEGWATPPSCDEVFVDCPEASRFTNCFLNSPVDCVVRVQPTSEPAVSYAGLFSGCAELSHQPRLDTTKCINMAAMFKGCRSMRFSLNSMVTTNVRNMRQMFMGCENFSGNGLAFFDFSSLSGEDAMRNFATGTNFRTVYYDQIIRNLHRQAVAGTLPTPMRNVDMGSARYSPSVADERQFLLDYGWEIRDGGQVEVNLSPLERLFLSSVDGRLQSRNFPGGIDLSPVCRTMRGGIAITPRHTLHVRHYMPTNGQPIKFWNGEEARVLRCEANPETWDIAIATLDRDVNVTPAQALPRDYFNLLPNLAGPPSAYPDGTRMPLVWVNKNNQIQIMDLMYVRSTSPTSLVGKPTDDLRLEHFGGVVTGDSGSPACLVNGERLVIAHPVANSQGSGVWFSGVLDWADELVARTGHKLDYLIP